ncbi:uncharacterized protein LOC127530398 [Acanthochromis polyacanthus]|uniref:uncharacterized protein LOC127530398 n=1 Tax=Acanthochromis polyacanthus TaxID=80966 RepID=UPI0022341DF4|nr:uncharacterized protein LOC127530398 [Acanthochromis polyacanthus]
MGGFQVRERLLVIGSGVVTDKLLAQVEYEVEVELNVTDIETLNHLRSQLINGSYFLALGPTVNVTHINITTVCSLTIDGFQCRCEDQFRWSCDQCLKYGSCDNITDGTCGCIGTVPPDGQYCQSVYQHTPAVVFEYLITVELNTTDVTLIDGLRNVLNSTNYPIILNEQIQLSDVNFTTVCSMSSDGFQCTCEDQYRWSCDQCLKYGSCDNITDDTCGCINAFFPGGQHCQSVYQHNFTACPLTTTQPPTTPAVVFEYLITVELNTTDVTLIDGLRNVLNSTSYPIILNEQIQLSDVNFTTVCSMSSDGFQCTCEDQYRWSCDQCLKYGSCDNITDDTCGCINAFFPGGQHCQSVYQHNFTACPLTTTQPPTTPAVVFEYLITVELNTTDVTLIDGLRNVLNSTSYPIILNEQIQLSDVNFTTVCSMSSDGFQCTCEDQYRWSCDQCLKYGSCDNITDDTCGCINAFFPGGQHCQFNNSLHNNWQHDNYHSTDHKYNNSYALCEYDTKYNTNNRRNKFNSWQYNKSEHYNTSNITNTYTRYL